MARPRQYDPEQALDRAVRLFWEQGYRDTSVQHLVDATGVQRYGLYEEHGDKRGLFLACLERYESVWVTQALGDLAEEGASLPQLLAFFERLRQSAHHRTEPPGCLLCNTATELGEEDAAAAALVEKYVRRLKSLFERALTNAKEQGELGSAIDPVGYSAYLAGIVLGGGVYMKTSMPTTAIDAYFRLAIAPLEDSSRG